MNKQSTVKVAPYDVGDMLVIHHFTGALLLSEFEARHLRALLNHQLADVPDMPIEEAQALVREQDRLVAKYVNSATP